MYLISVAPAVTALREVTGSLELAHDGSRGSIGDPDLLSKIGKADRRVVANDLEDVGVVRYESEKMVAVTGS
jgi:hypothetical protein